MTILLNDGFPQSPGEGGGGGVRDEGDRQLQRPLGPANNGECLNIQLPRASVDEPSERDGGSES